MVWIKSDTNIKVYNHAYQIAADQPTQNYKDDLKPQIPNRKPAHWQRPALLAHHQQVKRTTVFQVLSDFYWRTEHSAALLCQFGLPRWKMDWEVQWVPWFSLHYLQPVRYFIHIKQVSTRYLHFTLWLKSRYWGFSNTGKGRNMMILKSSIFLIRLTNSTKNNSTSPLPTLSTKTSSAKSFTINSIVLPRRPSSKLHLDFCLFMLDLFMLLF